jgi:hypothetical protein
MITTPTTPHHTTPHHTMELATINQRSTLCLPWRRPHEARVVTNHNPSRFPYWPDLVATPEIGRIGRLCWINSMPSEEAWGRVWWSNR